MKSEKLNIKVVSNAKRNKIVPELGRLKVYLTAPALEGRANAALIVVLAEYFNVKKNQVTIFRGETSRNKVVEILS